MGACCSKRPSDQSMSFGKLCDLFAKSRNMDGFLVYLNPKVPDEFVMHTVNGGGDPRYTPDPNRPNQTMQLKRPGADIIRTPTTPCKNLVRIIQGRRQTDGPGGRGAAKRKVFKTIA